MDVSVSGTIDKKTYLKKCRGNSAPLAPPLDPPMQLDAQIDIHSMILPRVRQKFFFVSLLH